MLFQGKVTVGKLGKRHIQLKRRKMADEREIKRNEEGGEKERKSEIGREERKREKEKWRGKERIGQRSDRSLIRQQANLAKIGNRRGEFGRVVAGREAHLFGEKVLRVGLEGAQVLESLGEHRLIGIEGSEKCRRISSPGIQFLGNRIHGNLLVPMAIG